MNKDVVTTVLKNSFKFGDKRVNRFFEEVAATAEAVSATPTQTRVLKNEYHVRKRWVERMWKTILDEDNMKDYIKENLAKIDEEINECFKGTVFLFSRNFDRGRLYPKTIRGYYVNIQQRVFFVSDENSNTKVTTYPLKTDIPEELADQMIGGVCASIIALREEVQNIKLNQSQLEEDYQKELRNIKLQKQLLDMRERELKASLEEARRESPKLTDLYQQMNSLNSFLTSRGSV